MITILSGGTGTPKLIQGIKEIYPEEEINVIVNTVENDYFSGVYVSADIDTVLYTFADLINDETWYGIKGDSFITNEQLAKIGAPELLRIGDQDRATKIQKTLLLKEHSLSEAVDIQRKNLKIKAAILPMSDEDSEIKIETEEYGDVEFHDFLIKYQGEPTVKKVKYDIVKPSPKLIETIQNSEKIIIGPSNPITSILPILSIEGVKKELKEKEVIAVSPFIGNAPVSEPAGKFMSATGYETSSIGVAKIYEEFLNTIVIDNKDQNMKNELDNIIPKVIITNTIMKSIEDKKELAKIVLNE